MTVAEAERLLPGRKMHVFESVGITRVGGEWTPAEVRDLMLKAEKIERRSGTDDPYGHELAILSLGRWHYVAI